MLTRLRQLLDHRWLVRLRQDRSIREALFVFTLTRTLIFLVLICVSHLIVYSFPETYSYDAVISLKDAQIARKLRQKMWQADAAHYMGIAKDGYQAIPFDVKDRRSQEFAFFPLHPMLLWTIGRVTSDPILWGAALCNLFFFAALVMLYKLTLLFGYGESVARRTLFYLAAFPVSYFFSAPFTESLFVLLTVGGFYAARRERWWVAGVLGLLASATRLTGVLLLPSLVILSWQMYRSFQVRKIVGLLLIPFGLFAFMFYSWWLSGNAWAFKHASEAWGRKPTVFFIGPLIKYLINPHNVAEAWNLHLLNAACVLLCLYCIYLLARRREWALAFYTLTSIILPLSSGVMQSFERYTMGFFPVFIALAVAAQSERVDQTIRFVFVFLLGIMTTLFAAGYTNALS
ncbi:MAG TPA: mannosyltransferase family protein [Pyrinomonadaceae bacterium]